MHMKSRKIAALVGLVWPSVLCAADTAGHRMSELEFSGLDTLRYYLSVWQNQFQGYPWVVKVSYTILLLCAAGVVLLAVLMLVQHIRYRRRDRFMKKLHKKYYDGFREVCMTERELSESEVRDIIDYEEKHWKGWRMKSLCRFFVNVRESCEDKLVQRNLTTLVRLFNLHVYLEDKLTFGFSSNKVRYLQVVQYLQILIPESVLVRLLNSHDANLSKSVRIYYLWASDYEPFRFMRRQRFYYYRPFDSLEVHEILKERHALGKIIPSFRPYIAVVDDRYLKSFLIREVASWGTDEDVEAMMPFFTDDEMAYRRAAFACMGERRYEPAEQRMIDSYNVQTEPMRLLLLETLLQIGSGKQADFFVRVYKEAASRVTRYAAIRGLYRYSTAGLLQFQRLKQTAPEQDRLLFEQVEAFARLSNQSPIISH